MSEAKDVKVTQWFGALHGFEQTPAILSRENYEVARFARVGDRDAVLLMAKQLGILLQFAEMVAHLTLNGEDDGSDDGSGEVHEYEQDAEDAIDSLQSLITRARTAVRQAVTGAA